MVKKFSTLTDTQRSLQSYIEKKKGRREIKVIRRRGGGIKRGENNLVSNQFPICSHILNHSEKFMELHKEEKWEEGDRGDQEEKSGSQKETDLASSQFPTCSPQPGTTKEIQRVG